MNQVNTESLAERTPSRHGSNHPSLFERILGERQAESQRIGEHKFERMASAQIIVGALLLLYVCSLCIFSPAHFPVGLHSSSRWPFLMDKPVGEDGYYMLTVADNIAATGRILYNRSMVATGIQPMATFVFAGLDIGVRALHGSNMDLIRAALLLGGVLFVIFAFQMGAIARKLSPAAFAPAAAFLTFLLVITDFTIFRLFTYGLETGVYLICVALCFQSTLRISARRHTSTAEAIWLGMSAGLAGEARIDFGVLIFVLLVGLLVMRWISPVKALITSAVGLACVSPWFLFLHRVSGSWMPSSGGAESAPLSLANVGKRVSYMITAVMGHLVPWDFGTIGAIPLLLGGISLVALSLLVWRNRKSGILMLSHASRHLMLVWTLSVLVLVVIYLVVFDSAHFYYRYTAPIIVLSTPLIGMELSRIRVLRRHAFAVASVFGLCFASWAIASLHSGSVGNRQTIVAGYVHNNFPHSHVGAFQSGVVGYFNRDVENLDGKLNKPALDATRQHRLPQYLDQSGIDVLVDWASVIRAALPAEYLQKEWRPCPIPVSGADAICLMRKNLQEPVAQNRSSPY